MALEKDKLDTEIKNNVLQTFSDAIAGRSIQLFYGVGTKMAAGQDYVLVRDSGISRETYTSGANIDIDFDITINKPTIVAGIATFDIYWIACFGGGAACNFTVTANVVHYDGSAETVLGTATSETINAGLATDVSDKLQCSVTKKLFKIGDILRITLTGVSSGASVIKINHDPLTANKDFKIWVPIVNLE